MNDHLGVANGDREIGILFGREVSSYHEFADAILQLRNTSVVRQTAALKELIGSACYLLGWFLGDLGKHYRNESKMSMDIDIQLTRKHLENLALG